MDLKQQLEKARSLRKAGRHQEAFRILAPLLAEHPGAVAVRWELAGTLIQMGQHDRALSELHRVIDSKPDFIPALLQRARLRIRHFNQHRAALADLDLVLQQEPEQERALRLRARAAQALGDGDLIRETRDRLIELGLGEPELRYQRACARLDSTPSATNADREAVIADLSAALEQEPKPEWQVMRGIQHTWLEQWDDARRDFEAVLAATRTGEPEHLTAQTGLRHCENEEPFDNTMTDRMAGWLQDQPSSPEPEPESPPEPHSDDPEAAGGFSLKGKWGALKSTVKGQVNQRLADQLGQEIATLVRPPPPRYEVPSTKVPGVDWRFHRRVESELEALGFEELGEFESLHLSEATGTRNLVRFYVDEGTIITARVANSGQRPDASLARLALKTVGQDQRQQVIELITEFEDGWFLMTDNGLDQDPFDACDAWHPERLPAATPVNELVARHQRRVAEHAQQSGKLPRPLDGLEDLHDQQRRLWELRNEWRKGIDWFRDRELAALLAERYDELGPLVRKALVERLDQVPS